MGRRRATGSRNTVVSGSVWESRMKSDEVKGGIKVFNGEEKSEEAGIGGIQVYRRLNKAQTAAGGAVGGKRKTWKSENSEGFEKNPVQIAKERSDEQCKELSVSTDSGIKRSPIQARKTRSEGVKELSVSVNGIERSPIQLRKTRSESHKGSEISDSIERNSMQLRKAKSELKKDVVGYADRAEKSSKSELDEVNVESGKDVDGIDKNPIEIRKNESDNICKEFGVCQEQVISSCLGNVAQEKSAPEVAVSDDYDDEFEDDEELVDEEIEKKCFDIKEVTQISSIVNEEKKFHQTHDKPIPVSSFVYKQAPIVNHSTISSDLKKPAPNLTKPPPKLTKPSSSFTKPTPNITKSTPIPNSYEFQRIPETQNKLQNFVDLIMWRDVSKSAFVFGLGTFTIVSSSYTNDLNISLISVISYLGLVYLALIFLYRSIICRGVTYVDDSSLDYVVGEEEAIWLLKLILPYLNEFLLKVRALFCGDPATTMKLAAVLFVLARCGSSITIWKMAKLGFFGVFTVPKVCTCYSSQLTGYGKFWVQRFGDAWESCSHKKAVAAAIFTLVWNLSSIVARIWAVFMLFVAFRFYQLSMVRDDEDELMEDEAVSEEGSRQQHRQGRGPTLVDVAKVKKGS